MKSFVDRCPAFLRAGILCAALACSLSAANSYLVHNLVSDLPNTADHVDSNLVNPWGIAFSPTSPFWIGNNGTGTSTLYNGSGTAIALVVTIPSPTAPTGGAVSGVIFNSTKSFLLQNGKPASFLFCTEDGTIAGWNGGTAAALLVDNSATTAVYKGCAIGGTSSSTLLYAADFRHGKVAVWDGNLNPVQFSNAFIDPAVPAGFAPFNIMSLNGALYVTYAKQDDQKMDDVAGAGNGYVAIFNMAGGLQTNLIDQGPLNSPWGLAIAPSTFGDFANQLLVANFGDGTINAFNPNTGAFAGTLNDPTGKPISFPGIWGLLFGNGGSGGDPATLYFTAGIAGPSGEPVESHGLFASIQAAPSIKAAAGIVNAASFSTFIAPNTWASIMGGALSASTGTWQSSDFVNNALPTTLDGVTVTINGESAYIEYVSPTQINFLVPADISPGAAQIQLANNGLTSATESAEILAVAPSFFLFAGTKYIAATHSDNVSLVGPPNLITGATTTPVQPGDTVVLYGNGFGVTNPPAPNGQLINAALSLATLPTITIGGVAAKVVFGGLTEAGLYQFNVVVPAGLPAGDAAVFAETGNSLSQANAFITIAAPAAP
jgi:uncharacterized protein (TIGR03118 family)